jgi:hypothetical protein
MRRLFLLYIVIMSGCSDYKISSLIDDKSSGEKPQIDTASTVYDTGIDDDHTYVEDPDTEETVIEEPDDREPDIDVSVTHIDFGKINAISETETRTVLVTNVGDADLNISDIIVTGSPIYTLSPITDSLLIPGQSGKFTVIYDPETYETNAEVISILSNDPDEPIVDVNIIGDGSAPIIDVDPDYFDLGTTFVGCDNEVIITISNLGDVDLVITDINYFVSYPTDMLLMIDEAINGPLPWIVPPSSLKSIIVGHEPLDEIDDVGRLEIESNDPVTPIARADQDAIGEFSSSVTDEFEQEGITTADILFVIDNSGSMGIWQTALTDNFTSFISVFSVTGVDYQIAVITTDDATFRGPILSDTTPDLETEFTDQAIAGTYGSAMEKGLQHAEEATSPGGDASPGSSFLRADAKLIIIFVSDEKDWSSKTDAEYVTHFNSLKTSESMIVTHAVVGDAPSGCSLSTSSWTNADYGEGYIEVSALTGGEFVSICSSDWGIDLEALAHDSILDSSFELSDIPFEESITVEVDGITVTDWTYNVIENSIVFDASHVPPTESTIEINYSIISDCDELDSGETF